MKPGRVKRGAVIAMVLVAVNTAARAIAINNRKDLSRAGFGLHRPRSFFVSARPYGLNQLSRWGLLPIHRAVASRGRAVVNSEKSPDGIVFYASRGEGKNNENVGGAAMNEKLVVVADLGRLKAYRLQDEPQISHPRLELLEDWE